MTRKDISRRDVLATGVAAALLPLVGRTAAAQQPKLKGRIRHSVCKWCYSGVSLDDLCQACTRIGIPAIDLLRPNSFKKLKGCGLVCSMTSTHGIGKGLNRPENHESCLRAIREGIEATAAAGFPNVITFSGNRGGMPDDVGLKHCTEALKQVVGLAERKNVTICLEYLNSKQHKDYMADSSTWCFDLVKAVGSPRFKILYDIYHVAMMEAKIVEKTDPATGKKTKAAEHNIDQLIKDNIDGIGHFHTGGFPGRKDIDGSQLLDYAALMRTIAATGFTGYVAQEFIPKPKDKAGKLRSLETAIHTCDV